MQMNPKLKFLLQDLPYFGVKQAWACLFGGLLLALIIASKLLWSPSFIIARYDFLFVAAFLLQLILLHAPAADEPAREIVI